MSSSSCTIFFFFGKIEEKEQDHFEKENTKAVE